MQTRLWICTVAIVLATAANFAGASVLTFDNLGIGLNQPIPQDYGDNIVNLPGGAGNPNTSYTYGIAHDVTPNVSVAYGTDPNVASGAPVLWSPMGDLINVFNPVQSATITLTASANLVQLYGFDFAGYAGIDRTIQLLQIIVDNTVAFSQTNVLAPGAGHNSLSSLTGTSPFVGQQIQILIDTNTGSSAGAVGFDNVDFGQTPEPASAALLGIGALALSRRRRS